MIHQMCWVQPIQKNGEKSLQWRALRVFKLKRHEGTVGAVPSLGTSVITGVTTVKDIKYFSGMKLITL